MAWRGGGGGRDRPVDDYDEYDPTPYSGGYDISLTFGRPLPPSDDICYPISSSQSTSSSSSTVDYNRAQHSSDTTASAYYADTDSGDRRNGRPRPKPEPQRAYNGGGGYGMSEEYGYGERDLVVMRGQAMRRRVVRVPSPATTCRAKGKGTIITAPNYGDETEEEQRRGHHKYYHGCDYDDE